MSRLKSKNGKLDSHEIEDSINSISSAFEAIYRSERIDKISVKNYLAQIIQPLISGLSIVLDLKVQTSYESIDFLIPLGLIITELVNNSIKYAFKESEQRKISLTIKYEGDCISIVYGDNGKGYDLKSSKELQHLQSFGLNIVLGLVNQLNGTIEFRNNDGAYADIKLNKAPMNLRAK
jgi:two-component sensor histidine kinase